MAEERWDRVQKLFEESLKQSHQERDAFLDQKCSGDDDLRNEVESLLRHHFQASTGFMEPQERSPCEVVKNLPPPASDPLIGERVGAYRVKGFIGSGGMAQVYLAQQDQPRRTVALKVMKKAITSRSALRRFAFESQILGRLHHANIAQVYGAGTHDTDEDSVPYFAMEYVPNAKPITEYARHKDLNTRDRLVLFAKVCDAVYHGHQKGIIHRDLKPGNILIDSNGEPKVIDFGVARSTDSDMAVTTVQTAVGQLIGTLQYMSPEQCDADPDDLDIRSDVYSLGVVLYELLCDQLPYDLAKAAVYEAARIIREETPARPSTINRTLRGDVETIAMKAVEKDRNRRYQSAGDLARDILRYLRNEPIDARPPSLPYQVRMFARRNKAAFGTLVAIFAVLSVGIVAVTIAWRQTGIARDAASAQRAQAELERDRADRMFAQGHRLAKAAMGEFFTELGLVDLPGTLPARQLLVNYSLEYLEGIEDQAEDDTSLRIDIAWGHRRIAEMLGGERGPNLNRLEEAITHFEKAIAIHERVMSVAPHNRENNHGLATAHLYWAEVLQKLDRLDEALRHSREAVALSEALLAEKPDDDKARRLVASATLTLGGVFADMNDLASAEFHCSRSMDLRRTRAQAFPESDEALRDLSAAHIRMGGLCREKGDFQEALKHHEAALSARLALAELNPDNSPRKRDVMTARMVMVPTLWELGENVRAEEELGKALAMAIHLHNLDLIDQKARAQVPYTRHRYAWALSMINRTEEAIEQFEQAKAEYEALAADFPEDDTLGPKIARIAADIAEIR